MNLPFDRIIPFFGVLTLFGFYLFEGFVIDPKKRIILYAVVFFFLALDTISRSFRKGFRAEDKNRYIASAFGILAFLFSIIREALDLKPLAGVSEEVSAIPKLREFFLLLVVLLSLAYVVLVVLLEIGKASLEAQSNLAKSKGTLLQNAVLGLLIVLPIVIAVNYFAIKRNYNFDLSSKGKYSLSDVSRSFLKSINKDVTITAFYPRPLEADGPPNADKMAIFALTRIRPDVEILLEQIRAENPKISIQFINADVELDLLKDFGQVGNGWIVVRSKKDNLLSSGTPFAEEKVLAKEPKDLEELERKLVASILNVTTTQKKAYFTVSNGERYGIAFKPLMNEQVNRFVGALQFLNFKVSEWGIAQGWPNKLPEDADLIVILGPTVPFSNEAQNAIKKYILDGNGKLILTIEPKGKEPMEWLLASAGLQFKSELLVEREEKPGIVLAKRFPEQKLTELIQKKDLGVLYPYSGYLEAKLDSNGPYSFKAEPILETGYEIYADVNGNGKLDGTEKKDNRTLASVLTPLSLDGSKTGKVVVHSGTSWITDQFISYVVNAQFATVSITGLFLDQALSQIPPKKEEVQTMSLTDNQKLVVWALGVFVFPGLIMGIGSYFVAIRRKKSNLEI